MKDERTEEQKYQAWVDAVVASKARGWRLVEGWQFRAPSGKVFDLSGIDLSKLELLEAK